MCRCGTRKHVAIASSADELEKPNLVLRRVQARLSAFAQLMFRYLGCDCRLLIWLLLW